MTTVQCWKLVRRYVRGRACVESLLEVKRIYRRARAPVSASREISTGVGFQSGKNEGQVSPDQLGFDRGNIGRQREPKRARQSDALGLNLGDASPASTKTLLARSNRCRPRSVNSTRFLFRRVSRTFRAQAAERDAAVVKRLAETSSSRRSISFQISLKISLRTIFSMPPPGA